jgi:hypothetical protein
MTETSTWLRDYRRRVDDIGDRARTARTALDGVSGTAGSRCGAVTVTVSSSGELTGLTLGERAEGLSRPALAEAVLDAARRARADALHRSADALRPLVGDPATERFLAEHLPSGPGERGGDEFADGGRR